MDTIFNQIHIIGQEKIVLININQRLQPLTAHLRTGETESSTWASTTSILHISIASSQEKERLGRTQSAPRDKGMQTQVEASYGNNGL